MAYTQIIYQIIFSTKNRDKVLLPEGREELFRYMSGVMKNKKCHLYRINGVENYLHIVTHVHQTVALADLVKALKVSSSIWIKEKGLFPGFTKWQSKYGAFTYHFKEKDRLITYVKNQEEHHRKVAFEEEFRSLLKEHGVEFDEKYLF